MSQTTLIYIGVSFWVFLGLLIAYIWKRIKDKKNKESKIKINGVEINGFYCNDMKIESSGKSKKEIDQFKQKCKNSFNSF